MRGRGRILLDATPVCLETSARGIGRHVACILPHVASALSADGWEVFESVVGRDGTSLVPGSGRISLGNRALFRWLSPWQRQRFLSGRLSSAARKLGASALLGTDTSLYPAPSPGMRTALMVYDLIPLLDPASYLDTYSRGDRWMWSSRLPRRWREADLVFASTREVARTARELAGVAESALRVVHPGVDHLPLGSTTEACAGIDQPFFLYVGAVEPRKNVERLVHAFARLRAAEHGNALLVLAGPMAPFRVRMVERWASEAGVSGGVRILGRVDDATLQALYRDCLAFAFPSLMEGFGLPPLEAMRAGAPVLAARASCMPEVLGPDALWVDGTDVADIASGLSRLASDPGLRARLSAAGPDRAALYSWADSGRAIAGHLVRNLS